MPVITSKESRDRRIQKVVDEVILSCTQTAARGYTHRYMSIPRDVQREVRDILSSEHGVYSNNGSYSNEHYGEISEIKFSWLVK